MMYLIYILAGLGAGIVTGLAGLSAAVIITPMLVSLCGWQSYDAVSVALTGYISHISMEPRFIRSQWRSQYLHVCLAL